MQKFKDALKKWLLRYPSLHSGVRIVYDFTWYAYKIKLKRKALHKGFDGALVTIEETFSTNGIEYWPMFGTLLGLYRDKGPIAHDLDLDIGVWLEDRSKIRELLRQIGFSPSHTFKSASIDAAIEDSYEIQGAKVDICYCIKADNSIVLYDFPDMNEKGDRLSPGIFGVRELKLPLDGFETLAYKEIEIKIPSNIHEHLSCRYGDDYMTPNSNYDYRKNFGGARYLGEDGVLYKKI